MSVAIPIPLLQHSPDVNVSLGVGVDEYALVYDHDTARFVLRAPFDGTSYALLAGRAGGQTLYGGTGANDDITIHGTSNATRTTSYVLLQPTAGNVGIGTLLPASELHVATAATTSPRGVMSSQHSASVDGARFHMRKSRGTNAAPVIITVGDVLGRLVASGYDGANYLEMGAIDIVAAGTIASTRVPTEIRFLTATDAAPSVLTQRMVINKAGYVGIGLTVPTTMLDLSMSISGTSSSHLASGIKITNTDTTGGAGIRIGTDSVTPVNNGLTMTAYSSLFTDVNYRLHGAVSAEKSLFLIADGAVGNGGSNSILFLTGGYTATTQTRMAINSTGLVGIGTTAPATLLHAVSTTAGTNAVRNVLTLGANVTDAGVGAAGLGGAVLFTMETTTTVDTSAASVQAIIYEATHATRKFDLVLNAYDTAIREGLRIRGAGSEPAIGFYGVAPIARAILATGAGATADNIITALQNLGLVKQS